MRTITETDSPTDKLAKLLPAEVTAFHLSIRGVFLEYANVRYLLAVAAVSLVVSLFYISKVRGVSNAVHMALYAAIFAVWALTLDAPAFADKLSALGYADVPFIPMTTAAALVMSFLVPVLVPARLLASAPAQ